MRNVNLEEKDYACSQALVPLILVRALLSYTKPIAIFGVLPFGFAITRGGVTGRSPGWAKFTRCFFTCGRNRYCVCKSEKAIVTCTVIGLFSYI